MGEISLNEIRNKLSGKIGRFVNRGNKSPLMLRVDSGILEISSKDVPFSAIMDGNGVEMFQLV